MVRAVLVADADRGDRGGMDMDAVVVVTGSSDHHRWRRQKKGSISGHHHVVAQLLESPLPTPRRSCSGQLSADDDTLAPARSGCGAAADASPQAQRGHVPFEWESSPGVPKSAAAAAGGHGDKAERDVMLMPPPKPPPGRCVSCPAAPARHHHSNAATDSTSSDQQDDDGGGGGDDDDTFSGAMERVSSSDRLAALSARLSAIDGAVFGSSRRCRSPSFIMDRFLPAANAIATTSADKPHPRRRGPSPRPRRSGDSKSKRDWEAEAEAAARARFRFLTHIRRRALAIDFERPKHPPPPPHCRRDLPPCAKEEAPGEKTRRTPRACGLTFFVPPWSSAKPVLLGFHRSPARSRTPPRADVVASVLEKDDGKLRDGGGLSSHWHEERSGSGKWAMAALLGTSKRYCADARKALLSRLTRSAMDIGGDSPRIGSGRERSGREQKKAVSDCMLRSTPVKMPPLSPPSESWLSNARRSNAGSNKS